MVAGPTIVVVEDDRALNTLLTGQIGQMGYTVIAASSGSEARDLLGRTEPDLMILDMRLPDGSGFDFIADYARAFPIIVLTAYGTVDQAVEAVHAGASDYLLKPINTDTLRLAIHRALSMVELQRDLRYWQSRAQRDMNTTIIGDSPKVQDMRQEIALYAGADATVLIEGESGVGKELVAHAIHDNSDRRAARFVAVDCDPSHENAVAQELFGQEQGAGDGGRREGMLEITHNGTIYLNDIAEISLALQSKILRVMETGSFRRVGGTQDFVTNVRILAATSRNLRERVAEGRFRSELYYRLSAFRIRVPPLRERVPDIPLLAEHFLTFRSFARGVEKRFAPETLGALAGYDWPGNVRELRNTIERGVIMSGQAEAISPAHVGMGPQPAEAAGEDDAVTLHFDHEPTLNQMRDAYLSLLLDRHGGNRRKVAGILDVSERNTYRLIGKLPGGK